MESIDQSEEDSSKVVKDLKKLDTKGYPKHMQVLFTDLLAAIKGKKLKDFTLNNYLKYELKEDEKLVCAKVIRGSDTIVECLQCRVDSTCIICLDCFNNGNHEGHKFKIRTGSSGCCDCGDREAWKPSGFCKKHTGQATIPNISNEERERFISDWGYLFYWYTLSKKKDIGSFLLKFLKIITTTMHYTVLLEQFLSTYFDRVRHPGLPPNTYECSILDNIFVKAEQGNSKLFQEVFIQMFQSYSFKQALTLSFFRTYHIAILNCKHNLFGLGFQLLTSYELVLWVIANIKKPLLFDGNALEVDFQNDDTFDTLMQYISNLKSLCKLQNGANVQYIRLYLKDISNLDCLNYYFDDVENQWTDSPADSLITDSFYVQIEVLGTIYSIIRVLSDDPELFYKAIIDLIAHLATKTVQNKCYFALHRMLSLMLFAFLQGEQNTNRVSELKELLSHHSKIFTPFFRSIHFLLSSRVNAKIKQLHIRYFYFYIDAFREAFSSDIHMIKLFVRMGFLQRLNVMDFFMTNCSEGQTMAYRQLLSGQDILASHQDIVGAVKTVSCLLSLLTQLCVSSCEEIHLQSKIFKDNTRYGDEIKSLIRQYVASTSNCTAELMDHLKGHYLNTFIDEEIKQVCVFDKVKKCYQLKQKINEDQGFPEEYFMSKIGKTKEQHQKCEFTKSGIRPDKAITAEIYSAEMLEKLGKLVRNLIILADGTGHSHQQMQFAINGLVFEMLKISNVLRLCGLTELLPRLSQAILNCDKIPTLLDNKNRKIIEQLFQSNLTNNNNPNEELSAQQRKLRIREIQRKKLQEMRNKQKSFVSKNEQSLAKEEEEMAEVGSDQCVFCHNPIKGEFFVYCANFSMSNLYASSQLKAIEKKLAEDCNAEDQKLWLNLKQHYSSEMRSGRPVLTSCLHPMHFPCYLSYSHNKTDVVCPLCKRKTDLVVPVLRSMEMLNVVDTKNKLESVVIFFKSMENLANKHTGKMETEESDNLNAGIVNIVRSFVQVLCYNATFDELYFTKHMLRLYQELLYSVMLYESIILKFKQSVCKEYRKSIEDNSDLLLLSGLQNNLDPTKEYIRGSFESLIALTLADYFEGRKTNMIVKRIEEYRHHSNHHQDLFNKRASLLLKLLNLPAAQPNLGKMHAEQKVQKYVLEAESLKLVKLPEKYRELADMRGKCPNCDKVGNPIHLCLVCGWRGCMKCQVCSLQAHCLQRHCGNTLYINIETTEIVMTCFKECWRQSAIYTDDLGKPFNIFHQWDDYSLSQDDYHRIEQLLVRHQIPVTILYNRDRKNVRFNFDMF